MNNLTCQKTHILAWVNSDDTLSLKINGVKYFAPPRTDKRGEKYWKIDSLVETTQEPKVSLTPEELELVKSYQEKKRVRMPDHAFTYAEDQAYQKWRESKKVQESIESQSQKVIENLKSKLESKNESLNQSS